MKITGGPAFPRPASEDRSGDLPRPVYEHDGMTLRDYFAAHALAGMLAADGSGAEGSGQWYYTNHPADAASKAYDFADEMLKERES